MPFLIGFNLIYYISDFFLLSLFTYFIFLMGTVFTIINVLYALEFFLILPIIFLLGSFYTKNLWAVKRFILYFMIFSFLVSFSIYLHFYLLPSSFLIDLSSISFWYSTNVSLSSSSLNFFHNSASFISIYFPFFGSLLLYIDSFSLFFIILTTFLFPCCIIISWYSLQDNIWFFLFNLVLLEFFLVNAFLVSNLFFFFLFFEAILFPMFFIIGLWGSRDRKLHAVFQFLLYTLFGSICLYGALFWMLYMFDSVEYLFLLNIKINGVDQKILFILLFISFSFKIPLFPVHIWLPEAHVEAPTVGSVLLAGLLLKLGTYGMLRFMLPLLKDAFFFYSPFIFTLIIIGLFYTSFSTIRQLDLKKIIAYSSIGHMAFVILGLFSCTIEGILGSIYLMIGHGFISSALFLSIGILYDRYHTRNVFDLRCLVRYMPIFSIFFLFFNLANVSFPGTFNFIAEISVLVGLCQYNIFSALFSLFSIIFIMVYAFWMYNRIIFGNNNLVLNRYEIIGKYMDLSFREFILLTVFFLFILFFGLFPNFILDILVPYCIYIFA